MSDMIEKKYVEWLIGGDTGISSETIWAVMAGVEWPKGKRFSPSVPFDDGDFGRCYRLLKKFPEWRPRLQEVSAKYPEWAGLVLIWDELEILHEKSIEEGWRNPWEDGPSHKKLYQKIHIATGRKP